MDLDALPFPDYSLPHMERFIIKQPPAKKSLGNRLPQLLLPGAVPWIRKFFSVHAVYGYGWREGPSEKMSLKNWSM